MSATKSARTTKAAKAAKDPHDSLKMLKVAIVHDWLIGGGAERVVEELHHMFPGAPIYTSYATREWQKKLHGMVVTGPLQRWPFRKLRKFLPVLRIWWFSRLKLEGYDLVISSSGAEAKGVRVPEGTLHVNYCHAPTHYYWSRYDEYMKHPGFGSFDSLARFGLRILVGPLRKWDYQAAQRPHYMIANSTHIKDEIKKYYDRKAEVIYPPVNVDRFKTKQQSRRYGYVITGRQTPYKRVDLAVAACSQLKLPLKVIGNGPDHSRLTAMAGPTVRFLTKVTDQELPGHFQTAEAFLFPGIDDFGITPVEAMAAGTPVIAYQAGGALDYVKEGETGTFFKKQTVESLVEALRAFDSTAYDHKKIARGADKFAAKHFAGKMEKALAKYMHSTKKRG
ncbi:MAG TPA: glycosyltransferase [Candidatus Saccharimonadales bacterium]|nr:glycosyltransferase [Candidatus Saccharimonadales bacterium]